MKPFFHIVLVCFFNNSLIAQTAAKKADTIFCDCNKARTIKISGNQKIGPTISPPGFGEVKERSITRIKTKYAFEKEHHSAWYKLVINTAGNLSFDILPSNTEDDYDFMLFAGGKNDFCDSLEKNRLKPLRANISRDKTELKGKTGLSLRTKREFVKEGINDAYSASVNVNKGEIYYLVLDNVYENGAGHTIQFFFEQKVEVKGVVRNDEDRPLITEVIITDIKGETVAQTTTDPKTGAYELPAILRRNAGYSINYFNDSSFIFSKEITLKDTVELKSLKVILPKLRKGKKYPLSTINFYGNSDMYVPAAVPTIQNLCKLMEKNKDLSILIEGHVNCAHDGKPFGAIGDMELSQDRAKKIRDYLVRQKINSTRIETTGKGCNDMLFPKANTPGQEEANRRVEIKVLEF